MRARCNAAIREVASNAWSCEQSFKPAADLLMRAGIELEQSTAEQFALVLLLPPRQRDEARATMARALQRSAPSGIVVA
ncbi:MAG: 16S rRNA methyltransferase, partial [Rhodanobacteraceae bacterium]